MWMKIRNTFIIFLVSGFWHGANWTFIVWGFLNALFIMPSIVFNTNRNNLDVVAKGKLLPGIKDLFAIGLTFSLTVFAWIFFRAANVSHAFNFISQIFSSSLLSIPDFPGIGNAVPIIFMISIFILVEWIGREQQFAIANLGIKWPKPLRWIMYYAIISAIFHFTGKEQQFIYFQF
jgi:D-alanyl-lipoteichoic acid acyltransferase DltB (MBOAT superfamily)